MTKNIIFFICTILIFMFKPASAQLYQFSQRDASALIICPSYAGINGKDRIAINNRNSPDIPGLTTYTFWFDSYIKKLNSGWGFYILRDKIGDNLLTSTKVALNYTYNARLGEKWYFRPGVNINYAFQNIDFYNLVFSDQLANSNGAGVLPTTNKLNLADSTRGVLDFAASAMIYSDKYSLSFYLDHLRRPSVSLTDQDIKIPYEFGVLGKMKFNLRPKVKNNQMTNFEFDFLYSNQQSLRQLDLGLHWFVHYFSLGAGLRGIPLAKKSKYDQGIDAVIMSADFYFNGLSIGYSYDIALTEFINFHEISLVFEFDIIFGEDDK